MTENPLLRKIREIVGQVNFDPPLDDEGLIEDGDSSGTIIVNSSGWCVIKVLTLLLSVLRN